MVATRILGLSDLTCGAYNAAHFVTCQSEVVFIFSRVVKCF